MEAMMKMNQTMNERVIILDEPVLQFAGGHSTSDPHDGLALFGPYGQGTVHHCSSPPYIVVGTPFGLNLWDAWGAMMNRPAAVTDRDLRLWPPYPGFEVAFGSRWHEQPERRLAIDRDALLVQRFVSPYQVKPPVAGKAVAHRIVVRIAWDAC